MNSEELEVSLRAEFESYINGVRAELKQELVDFQKTVESEVEKHKSQLDEAFSKFSARLESDQGIDEALKESVMEHLRLARDDGAQLAASAAAEAEAMSSPPAAVGGFDALRDAIVEISSKTSQSAILKALTDHCSSLAARGAFFIVKNDNFVGWQVFGKDTDASESTARDIHFPVSADTVFAKSVDELRTVQSSAGSSKDDSKFLKSLKFGSPQSMFAVPLIARGRGVAVLYADGGTDDTPVHIDAIEALVRVAGLTVELLASSSASRTALEAAAERPHIEELREEEPPVPESFVSVEPAISEETHYETANENEPEMAEFSSNIESYDGAEIEYGDELTDTVPVIVDESLDDESYLMADSSDEVIQAEIVPAYQEVQEISEPESVGPSTDFAFSPVESEEDSLESVPVVSDELAVESDGKNGYVDSPAVEMNAAASNGRKRSRLVDLPIEVAEEEREKHKKARSFARLLVSEIKLYNPDKVTDGKEAKDLYDRLREAIDRSREMYNQRVDAPVSSRFDYFHYELVNGLAEGDESRLGSSYPGSRA